jgi:hypothetical protein
LRGPGPIRLPTFGLYSAMRKYVCILYCSESDRKQLRNGIKPG